MEKEKNGGDPSRNSGHNMPPVYGPATVASQPKAAALSAPTSSGAPPVYRSLVGASQLKLSCAPPVYRPCAPASQLKRDGAPPVYRPTGSAQTAAGVQMKPGVGAPPVYRPQSPSTPAPVYRPVTQISQHGASPATHARSVAPFQPNERLAASPVQRPHPAVQRQRTPGAQYPVIVSRMAQPQAVHPQAVKPRDPTPQGLVASLIAPPLVPSRGDGYAWTIQQRLNPGLYQVTVRGSNLRSRERKVLMTLKDGDFVTVLENQPEGSYFTSGSLGFFGKKEHSWVETAGSKPLQGWVLDTNLTVSDENLTRERREPPRLPSGETWSKAGKTVILSSGFEGFQATDTTTHEVVASIQTKVTDSGLTISGASADVQYPGLGALLMLRRIEMSKVTAVKISSMVGSFGFWHGMGLEIHRDLLIPKDALIKMTPADVRQENDRRFKAAALKSAKLLPGTQRVPNLDEAIKYLRGKAQGWTAEYLFS